MNYKIGDKIIIKGRNPGIFTIIGVNENASYIKTLDVYKEKCGREIDETDIERFKINKQYFKKEALTFSINSIVGYYEQCKWCKI